MSLSSVNPTVTVVGESLVDVVRHPDGQVTRSPGGSPLNVAVGLGRLGQRVELVTTIGDDSDGALIRDHLAASKVRLRDVPDATGAKNHTSIAEATISEAGDATYRFDLAWEPRLGAVAPTVVHAGSIGSWLAPGAEAARSLLGRATGIRCYDPNCRPALMDAAAMARARALAGRVDVVKASDEDLAFLYLGVAAGQIARSWSDDGVTLVIITAGADPVLVATASGVRRVPAPPVRVADTVGAGDSFMAALIDGLLRVGADTRPRLAKLAEQAMRIEQIVARAAACAAITCTRPGADPPWAAEAPPLPSGN